MTVIDPNRVSPDSYFTQITARDVNQYLFLFYGGSGSGKTRLAAQLGVHPAMSPMLFLSSDTGVMGGLLSGVQFSPLQVRITSYQQLVGLYSRLEADAGKAFKAICFDSLTSFNQLVLRDILAPTFRETAVFADWNLAVARMRNVINKIASFGVHTIYTATEQITKDEQLGKMMGLPNLPGKLAQEAPAGVDIVLHFHTRTSLNTQGKRVVNYLASTAPDEIWYAKDRSTKLPSEILIPPEDGFKPFEPLFADLTPNP